MAKIALFGANGYLGRAVADQLREADHQVTALRAPRLRYFPEDVGPRPERLLDTATIDDVGVDLLGHDVVVNAAGLASGAGRQIDELYGANAVWPLLAALACGRAGVGRLVHLSSTAVQGLAPVLDSSDDFAPEDTYGASRVRGEQLLSVFRDRTDPAVTVYRVPSVYGAGRRPSYPLASRRPSYPLDSGPHQRWRRRGRLGGLLGERLAGRLPLLVVGAGDQPVAAAHVTAVTRAVAALVVAEHPPAVVTHPPERHTVRSMYRDYETGRRVVRVPVTPVRAGLDLLGRFPDEPRVSAGRRRVSLALLGQTQLPSWLDDTDCFELDSPVALRHDSSIS